MKHALSGKQKAHRQHRWMLQKYENILKDCLISYNSKNENKHAFSWVEGITGVWCAHCWQMHYRRHLKSFNWPGFFNKYCFLTWILILYCCALFDSMWSFHCLYWDVKLLCKLHYQGLWKQNRKKSLVCFLNKMHLVRVWHFDWMSTFFTQAGWGQHHKLHCFSTIEHVASAWEANSGPSWKALPATQKPNSINFLYTTYCPNIKRSRKRIEFCSKRQNFFMSLPPFPHSKVLWWNCLNTKNTAESIALLSFMSFNACNWLKIICNCYFGHGLSAWLR